MIVDITEFRRRAKEGLIRSQTLDDLIIWNYTAKCQYARAWDEYTIRARGLITDRDGNVRSVSFPKFWNLGERPETQLDALPKEDPVVTRKLDGFLGISYRHNGMVKIASRGSFTSEYAQWATEWLNSTNDWAAWNRLNPDFTYVFEILYPHRRIVVDNGGNYGLHLLAVFHTDSGAEIAHSAVRRIAEQYGWPVVAQYPTRTITECLDLAKTLRGVEQEGFVAHYPSAGLRVKIKGDDYSKIHRIATRLSVRRVWELLASGKPEDMQQLQDIKDALPRSYAEWVHRQASSLSDSHVNRMQQIQLIALDSSLTDLTDRKSIVMYLQENYPDLWREALYWSDGKFDSASGMVWKSLRPEHEVPLISEE